VTEERLAGMVCASVNESVKDYLSGVTDYVARCQQRVAELEEALGFVTDEKHALQRQVDELKECLNAIYTGKVSSVTNHYNGCEVTQHYLSEQTQIVNPTFGAMYDVHGNGKVSCGN
jgi:hypothetical protein